MTAPYDPSRDFYIEILETWGKRNFDNAIEVHNTIWNANDGTIGRAYNHIIAREEYEYIQQRFR